MTMTWLTKLLYDSMLMNHWSIRIDNYVSKSNTVHQCTHWHIIHTRTAIVLRHYGLFCVVSKWQKHGHWQRGSWQAFDKHLAVDTTPSFATLIIFGNHRSEHHHCRRTSHMGSDCHQKTGATWLHLWMHLCQAPPWVSSVSLGSGSATGPLCMIHPWSWLCGSANCDWDSSSWVVIMNHSKGILINLSLTKLGPKKFLQV